MVDKTEIVNRALQTIGTRTTVTALELANNSKNEALQANLIYDAFRDNLLRMAPWDCAFNTAVMTYITSSPGTPENTSSGSNQWQKGQPPPPWVYEYQYPVDCLRACRVIPVWPTGFAGDTPITTAITGGIPSTMRAPPVVFKVMIDQFYPVTAATVANGGTGYAVGDLITLAQAPQGSAPVGAPVILRVATAPAGVVGTVTVVNQIAGSATPQGGSYFAVQANPVAQGSTTGAGVGATFNLTFGAQDDQRVIVCNQENAILQYVRQVTNPNVMDNLFVEAWIRILGAGVSRALTGKTKLANDLIKEANEMYIAEARKADGNEGLTIQDTIPDWIRARGAEYDSTFYGPFNEGGFDWGPMWPVYA